MLGQIYLRPVTGYAVLAVYRGCRQDSFEGDMDMDVEVDVDTYFGCFKGGSKSVQVLLNGILLVLT